MVTGRTAAAETAASSGRSRPLLASIQTSFTALSRRRCRSAWLSSRKPPLFRTGGPATSRKGSGRTYRGEAGLPECVSARWARPRDWARWLSPNGSRDGPAGVRDARHFVGMPALDCVSLCSHARFRYLRRTNPRVGRYTPIHLPGEMATSEPRRPGRPRRSRRPVRTGTHQRAPAARPRLLWRRSMSVFDSRQKTSASLLGAVLVGECCSAVRRSPSSRWARAASGGGERRRGKCGEGKCGSGGSARPGQGRRRGQVRGGQVRRRLLCPNRHRSRWQGLARRVPRGGQGPCR